MLDTVSIGRPIRRGQLTLYPLYTHTPPGGSILTGPEATASGLIEVQEAPEAQVPVLIATNLGGLPVLLLEGEALLGGLQDRILNATVLVGIGSARLPVSCVEAGRWGEGGRFTHAGWQVPRRVRARMSASVTASLRTDGTRRADQGAVWYEVGETLVARGRQSETAALRQAMLPSNRTSAGLSSGRPQSWRRLVR
jgi:hypothetical protein